jgi:hypothetical protein
MTKLPNIWILHLRIYQILIIKLIKMFFIALSEKIADFLLLRVPVSDAETRLEIFQE